MDEPMEGFAQDEWDDLVHHYREDLIHKMVESAFVVSIVPKAEPDLKIVIETGLAVLLDKPIIAVAVPGAPVPENMRRMARQVVEVDLDTQEGREEMAAALSDIVADFKAEGDVT